ncbi:hypothetical protein TPA0907_52260 [Micromonospora humidisoli]|uniref:LPXTG cell wall anchor domain-containing protein n=1 Tax=Micromonospora humidisoli TaxID=2807622 RepID=A0ABS2JCJ8_9ACTN|nr:MULTISPECIES: LPXTG cell wall anchor domain-containing protein [Micromonospora]MBM7083296.1 LPXTG cell wall anchor domain-containing protein [Micromonospora humidisoli]GHJ10859.1 hypothetical protein TPA0907_52260 [Micromonospora sp. AKA109]
MFYQSGRRWLAGLGVAGALVAAAPPSAHASASVDIYASDVLVAPGRTTYHTIEVGGPREEDPLKTTLDIDFSQVDAIASIKFAASDWKCVPVGKGLHCEHMFDGQNVPDLSLDYRLTAKANVKPGTKATLTLRASNGSRTGSADVTVTVAKGVDLRSEPKVELDIVPGATAGLPADVVRNAGDNTAHGAVLRLQTDHLSPDVGSFSNCDYLANRITICTFDTDLEPGRSYRLSTKLPIKLDESARSGSRIESYVDWWTRDDWAIVTDDPRSPLPPGKPGTGEELKLVEVRTARQASVPQTDVDQQNNSTVVSLIIGGDNTADVTADGATVTAKVGDKVEVWVGWTNLGPATVDVSWLPEPFLRVEIPKGTKAVKVSEGCAPYDKGDEDSWNPWENGGKPGAARYGCIAAGNPEAGVSHSYPFTLRIDKLNGQTSGKVVTDMEGDSNAANNQAKLVVKARAAGPGGSGGGDGGSLPITGQSVTLIAGVGGLLVAAGFAGFVVARRRTRFTA